MGSIFLSRGHVPGALTRWNAAVARAQAGGEVARILMVGDSITAGYATTTPLTDRACVKLRTKLANDYGSGAVDGWHGWSSKDVDVATTRAEWSLGAGWVTQNGWSWGANALLYAINQTTTTSVGPFTCTGFRIMYLQTPGGTTGAFDIKVDGGSTLATLSCFNASSQTVTATVSAGALGSHTLNIVAKNPSVGFIVGVEPLVSGSVVSVGHCGVSTSTVEDWNSLTNNGGRPSNSIQASSGDLYVINLGLNDHLFGVAPATFGTRLTTLAATCYATGGDLIFTYPNARTDYSGDPTYPALYRAQIATLAASYNAPIVDLFSEGASIVGGDGLHLTTAGAARWADLIYEAII